MPIAFDTEKQSSPRVWGQVAHQLAYDGDCRIIPTRVGTRHQDPDIWQAPRDHPHACGDKYIKNMTEINPLGSSPRVWGQDIKNIWCSQIVRIIPTRVGTSCNVHIKQSQFWDHPHACGDKFAPFSAARRMSGSSPRVWGQV